MAEPNDSDYEFEYVPCPCCETPLEARSWGKMSLRRIEVKTESSWVLLYIAGKFSFPITVPIAVPIVVCLIVYSFLFSGDLVLPCCMCLAADDDLQHSEWRRATMNKDQLSTHMLNRYVFGPAIVFYDLISSVYVLTLPFLLKVKAIPSPQAQSAFQKP